jgi:hypothetical protein
MLYTRKKTPLISLLLFTVITAFTSCITTSELQCDELYGIDYDCQIQHNYTFNPYTPYRGYYPNTQTIYYVPIPTTPKCDEQTQSPRRGYQITGKRPDIRNRP